MDTADSPQHDRPLARIPTNGALGRPPIPAGPFPRPAPAAGPALNARMIWRAVLRHWWQALALWVVGTATLGALVWMKFKPEYEAFGLLKIEPDKTDLFNIVRQNDSNYMETQLQLITSPNVLLATAADRTVNVLPSIAKARDQETKLREMITVTVPSRSYLIRVSAKSEVPAEPSVIVNSVIANYRRADFEWADGQTGPLITKLEEYGRNLDVEITGLKNKLTEHAKKGQIDPEMLRQGIGSDDGDGADQGGGSSRYKVEVAQYSKLKSQLIGYELDIATAEGLVDIERRRAEAADPHVWVEKIVEREFLNDPEVAALTDEIRDTRMQLEDSGRRIRRYNDPTLTGLRSKLAGLEGHYRQLWDEKKVGLREQAQALAQSPDGPLIEAEQKLDQLKMLKATTEELLAKLEIDTRALGLDQLQASLDQSDLNQLRQMKQSVDLQLRQLKFDQTAGSRIIVISEGRDTGVPILNRRTRMLALVPLAVLGAVVALCTLLELKAGRVGSPDELSARVAVEVFAVPPLPVVRPSRGLRGPRSNDAQFELFVQQLDHLRVALCGEAQSSPGRGRCVLITSATGGEGKTTLAAQLAVRCAEAGASTVLVDADLRRATLGRLFEVPECPGLSDVLRGEANLEDALVAISQVGGCQLLPAGSPESNPNRILRGQRFGPMIEQLRRTFDVIIIDTSPVLPVPDALIMGRYADGVVLAARHDRSRFPLVERANHLLTGAGVPVLGVVINGVQPTGMRYGDYAYTYRSDRGPAAGDDAVRGRVG